MPASAWNRPSRTTLWVAFGGVSLVVGAVIFALLYYNTLWNPYAIWVIAWTAVALALYAYDKVQAKRDGLRAPKLVLHAVAALGGFLGGWAGMLFFHHKVAQADFWIVLLLSTIGHAALVAVWFVA